MSAFRALSDMLPSNKNAGLVLDWQQGQGKLLVAGDVKVVRVWNAATEICVTVSSPRLLAIMYPHWQRLFPSLSNLRLLMLIPMIRYRIFPPAPRLPSRLLLPTKSRAISSAPPTATGQSAFSTLAYGPP